MGRSKKQNKQTNHWWIRSHMHHISEDSECGAVPRYAISICIYTVERVVILFQYLRGKLPRLTRTTSNCETRCGVESTTQSNHVHWRDFSHNSQSDYWSDQCVIRNTLDVFRRSTSLGHWSLAFRRHETNVIVVKGSYGNYFFFWIF